MTLCVEFILVGDGEGGDDDRSGVCMKERYAEGEI